MFDFACNELKNNTEQNGATGNPKNSKWIFMVNSQNQNKRPIREIVSGVILSRIHYYFSEYIYFCCFFLRLLVSSFSPHSTRKIFQFTD